ncbi:MAG TPA: hypothetical protein VIH57_20305 [Bacteroidales bacterium]
MKRYFLIFLTIVFVFAGCKKETELQKSVFINDPENPDLPEYSEWGYNTFGAYYDRVPFISNDNEVPAKVIVTNNVMSFALTGQKGGNTYYYGNDYGSMSITFKISGFLPQDYNQLITLNDTILDLKNSAYQVVVSMDTNQYTATILSGQLQFKRVQNLLVDTKQVEVILSGYFDFKALIKNSPITVSSGRFDVGIDTDNFYVY